MRFLLRSQMVIVTASLTVVVRPPLLTDPGVQALQRFGVEPRAIWDTPALPPPVCGMALLTMMARMLYSGPPLGLSLLRGLWWFLALAAGSLRGPPGLGRPLPLPPVPPLLGPSCPPLPPPPPFLGLASLPLRPPLLSLSLVLLHPPWRIVPVALLPLP